MALCRCGVASTFVGQEVSSERKPHEECRPQRLVADSPDPGRGHGPDHRPEHVKTPAKLPLSGVPLTLFLGLGGAFVCLKMWEGQGGLPRLITSYADDFLCLPLVLAGVLLAHRWMGTRLARQLPLGHGLAALGAFSLYFEVILPRLSSQVTADPWDVAMYVLGFVVFQVAINRPVAGNGAGLIMTSDLQIPPSAKGQSIGHV